MRQSRSRNPTPLPTNENAHRKHLPRRKHAFLWQIMPLLLINSLIQEGEGRRAAITSPFTQTAEGAVKWRQRNEITFLTANELSLLIQRVSLHHWERERERDGGMGGCKNEEMWGDTQMWREMSAYIDIELEWLRSDGQLGWSATYTHSHTHTLEPSQLKA